MECGLMNQIEELRNKLAEKLSCKLLQGTVGRIELVVAILVTSKVKSSKQTTFELTASSRHTTPFETTRQSFSYQLYVFKLQVHLVSKARTQLHLLAR